MNKHQLVIQNLHNKVLEESLQAKTILKMAQEHRIDWMHACGGKGRCTTCRVKVLQGMEGLAELTAAEQKYRDIGRLQADERLSCQALVHGRVVVQIPDACKFPQVSYSE
jgi:2Fe-2S ferredoxin